MRIGVFGGSFDPPHNGHLALCLLACEQLELDRLIVSVSRNPFKSGTDAPDDHRRAMTELLVAEIDRTHPAIALLDTSELESPGPSYTVDLLLRLRREWTEAELFLLVGEDSYREMSTWREPGEISRLSTVVVFARRACAVGGLGDTIVESVPARFVDFDVPVSATGVRELLAKKEPVAHLVPRAIVDYIEAVGLYR